MEQISALMDGELEHEEASRVIPSLNKQSDLREAWATYHLIGEALRGQACNDCAVAHTVSSKLAVEPTVLAPRRGSSSFGKRWALPSMAAAAAVAAVTWVGLTTQAPQGVQEFATARQPGYGFSPEVLAPAGFTLPVSLTTVPAPSSAAPPIQLSWQEFQAYLMAHQEFSPSISTQGLAPLVRSVSTGAAER